MELLIPLPQLTAKEWRKKCLENWEELLEAQNELLEAQKRVLEASRDILAQLKEKELS